MQFSFQHNTHALLPFLLKVNQYLQDKLPPGKYDKEAVLSKCKLIITELCTNSIKHSGLDESFFDITINGNRLIIKRSDKGIPFHPKIDGKKVALPLPGNIDIVTLTEDDINRLNMQRIDDYTARFYVENTSSGPSFKQDELNEHFGLIIICLSSDNFTYTYDVQETLNEFAAVIELEK